MAQNLSFVLEKQGVVKFEDRPMPQIIDPHDVIINVKQTGICGSDVHYWVAGRIGNFIVESPMVLGHESSGVIYEVGSAVTTLKVGDRVTMEPGFPCRRCTHCKVGVYNLCPHMAFAATPPFDGTLAKYYVLPEDYCFKIPDHMSFEEAAVVEPLSVAVHLNKRAETNFGKSIIVFGAGPVGLLCLAVARAFGATMRITVEVNEIRADFAMTYAATHKFIPKKDETPEATAQRIKEECGLGDGADIVIDASGAESCIRTSILALRSGGTHVQGGMGSPEITFPITDLCVREINLKGSFRYGPGDYQLAVELISTGKVCVKELITSRFKFEECEEAFRVAKEARGIKVMIENPQ